MAFREFSYEEYIEQVKKDFYEEGLEDALRTVAVKLKAEGIPADKIAQITGLEKEVIEEL